MSETEKKQLLNKLTETHQTVRAFLDDVDMDKIAHKDTGWRVRDIVGHIATWDQEAAKSLRAYLEGTEYLTPDLDEDEVDFNERAVLEQHKLSTQQILAEFEKAYDELWAAVADIPFEQFPGDLLYPWGDERGDISTLVEYMIEHSIEHQEEIIKTVQGS